MLHLLLAAPAILTEQWSEEHGRAYYWDSDAGEATWTRPTDYVDAAEPAIAASDGDGDHGWTDCTSDAAAIFSGGALQRAWRRVVLDSHPDKGGSTSAFQSATETRDFLKSPLRYFTYRTLHERRARRLTAFDELANSSALVRGARAMVGEDGDGWPRLTVEASFSPDAGLDLGRSHVWRLALSHANASTIEYRGDETAGGHDVCCGFVRGSRCVLRPRDDTVAMLNASVVAPDARPPAWFEQRDAHYAAHDCPLPAGPLNASLNKPLHLKQAGRWAAVLLLLDGAASGGADPAPTACVSLLFHVGFVPRPPREAPPPADATNASAPVAFEQVSSGRWCRDGGDVLEGKIDDYTDCDERGLCKLTRKCRERCVKRKACRYYSFHAHPRHPSSRARAG